MSQKIYATDAEGKKFLWKQTATFYNAGPDAIGNKPEGEWDGTPWEGVVIVKSRTFKMSDTGMDETIDKEPLVTSNPTRTDVDTYTNEKGVEHTITTETEILVTLPEGWSEAKEVVKK